MSDVWVFDIQPQTAPPSGPSFIPLAVTSEPTVHILVGAQFGDLEYDVGKSVRWLMWFCDDTFVLDINSGDQRYWVINWAETFPGCEHGITSINFFARPGEFRAEQFRQAEEQYDITDEDWILWVDAHEGFSVDNRTLPDDYEFMLFMSWVYREIQRAVDAGHEIINIPFFAFLRSDDIQNVTHQQLVPHMAANQDSIAIPYYLPYQALPRLTKVSALRAAGFDWKRLDQPVAASTGVKVQIVSYAYAHWSLQDIVPPATTVAPLTEANDDGWRMRNLISRVRPIPGIPYGTTWHPPADDSAGFPGPWALDALLNVNADATVSVMLEKPITPAAPEVAMIRVPLYDLVFRINLRDGLWYVDGDEAGNIPLRWNSATEEWYSEYNPVDWAKQ